MFDAIASWHANHPGHPTSTSFHEFWSDDASILDDKRFHQAHMHSHRQITGLYFGGNAVARLHGSGFSFALDRDLNGDGTYGSSGTIADTALFGAL